MGKNEPKSDYKKWLSNSYSKKEKITEEDRIKRRGFDSKYSFRKAPKK